AKWVGLSIGIAGLVVFLALAWAIQFKDGPVCQLDRGVAEAMQQHAAGHKAFLEFARDATQAGGVSVMMALAIVGGLLLWLCDQPRLAEAWVLAAALGCAVNFGSKEVFARDRPDASLRDEAVHERNASYPSGHAMGTVIGYGMLGYVCELLLRRRAGKILMAA